MNFLEIQDAVLSDRFDETKRARAKQIINSRYGRLWSKEPWAFKIQPFTVAVTLGATTAALTGIQRVLNVFDAMGSGFNDLEAIRPEDLNFYASTASSLPFGFTVSGGVLRLDRPASAARTLTVIGEAAWTALSADVDIPLLPSEFHEILVSGPASTLLREENDPTWQGLEADFQAMYEDMKSAYLVSVRTYGDAAPAWP